MSTPHERAQKVTGLASTLHQTKDLDGTQVPLNPVLDESSTNFNVDKQLRSRRHCCSVRYKLRWFYSKGAFLVLLWIFLSSTAAALPYNLFLSYTSYLQPTQHSYFFYFITVIFVLLFVFALLSGWIADSLLGNYKTVKTGAIIFFISLTLFCTLLILLQSVTGDDYLLLAILSLIFCCLNNAGYITILITSLQLGLDQMPDASSTNITSFIAWFLVSEFTGFWLGQWLIGITPCVDQLDFLLEYFEILGLLAVLCASIILISDFYLAKKWLKKEPKSPQALKGIYKVLKYAKDHTYPADRSALTYWEEELPSRIDFGKSKYGGPFTTEQVENVKTFFRMLVVGIPMLIIFTSNFLLQVFPADLSSTQTNGSNVINNTECSTTIIKQFTDNSNLWFVVGIVINEFTIYPFVRKSLTILRRFGSVSFLLILVNSAYLTLNAVSPDYLTEDPMGWSRTVQAAVTGLLRLVMLTSCIEFVCAQSPLDMRSLLIGYIWCVFYLSYAIDNILLQIINTGCSGTHCAIVYYSLGTVLSLVGFVLYIFLARWYKRRIREDVITTQQLAEEIYDRYLSEASSNPL